jgi:IclR family mhp operon transcriptional activator
LAPTRTIVHVPLLTTASGRVMTAMLPAVEREALLRRLGADRSARDLVEEAASLGYGASQSSVAPRMSGLAVVARGQGRPVVCISAMFIRSAVRLQEAIERYLPEIQEIAARIEAALGDQELPRAS